MTLPLPYTLFSSAIRFAVHAHSNHFRNDGEPYITHLARVAALVSGPEVPHYVALAAWLHDVVEDVGKTYTDLRDAGFGSEVVTLVSCLTKVSNDESPEETIRRVVQGRKWAVYLKLADRFDNLKDGYRSHGSSYITDPKRLASSKLLLEAGKAFGLSEDPLYKGVEEMVEQGRYWNKVEERNG